MKIRTRLRISTIFSIGLTLVLGITFVLAARTMTSINAKIRLVDETIAGVSELNLLTYDYLLHPEERALTQWRAKHSSIANILMSDEFQSANEQAVLSDMRREHDSLKTVFDRLVASRQEYKGNEESVVYQELKERLSGQLSIKLQKVVSGSLQLADLNRSHLATAQRIRLFVTIFTGVSAVITAGITFWSSTSIVRPIADLTQVADSVSRDDFSAAGDLVQQVAATSNNEFGVLAAAFGDMISQLRDSIEALRQRSAYLEASASVGRATALILDIDVLIQEVVDLIEKRLDLYYAGLFLVDETGEWAVLRAGTGDAGQQMLAQGLKLAVGGESMIGRCVATGEAGVQLDVGQAAVRFEDPFLPETRSEMALPLRSRGRVIGAMMIQSTRPSAFDKADVSTLQNMADQIAAAIYNDRLYAEARAALSEMEAVQRRYQVRAWSEYARTADVTSYEAVSADAVSLDGEAADAIWSEEMRQAAAQRRLVVVGEQEDSDRSALVAPITFRDTVIGALGVSDEGSRRIWSEGEIALVQAVVEQMGQVAENLRLFDEMQRSAAREQLVAQATAHIQEPLDLQAVLRTAANEIRQTLELDELVIRLVTPENVPRAEKTDLV